jgi:cell division protein FtsL
MSREQERVRYGVVNNAALKPDYYGNTVPKREVRPTRAPQPKAKPQKQTVNVKKTVFMMFLVAAMMGVLISRYAVISANNIKLHRIENQIQVEKDKAAHLEIELAAMAGTASSQQEHGKELGMNVPTEEQVRTVALSNTTQKAVTTAPNTTNWFDRILDAFD